MGTRRAGPTGLDASRRTWAHGSHRGSASSRVAAGDRYGAGDALTAACPVAVQLRFDLRRPVRGRRSWPCVRPDLDKLARAVLDAITESGLVEDDGQVCELSAVKRYAESPDDVGVTVEVAAI